jgi:hypothetical protein
VLEQLLRGVAAESDGSYSLEIGKILGGKGGSSGVRQVSILILLLILIYSYSSLRIIQK